ncbi:ECs_2282 family putative zinc-binding protein [Aerococcus viridans]|uniref:DUF2197 domain-containing protein n=2 Tax=Aerococcus viridans TaxID=1377 RepID=A0AAU8U7Q5_9LACT|nr:hypothetical protein AWM76_07120 [Aerococcus viridans]EFG50203.1 hypothetical protein HMPREF0061_0426 [Aerococcus viridans ATCC 11563 = CCUG 4311]
MKMNITLKCSVCANDQFSTVEENIEDLMDAPDETLIKCSDCGRVVTKEELIKENSHIIDANLEDFKKDIFKEVEKDLKKAFKKWK